MSRFCGFVALLLCGLLHTLPAGAKPPAAPVVDQQAVDQLIEAELREHDIPGLALGIVHGGKTLYAKGWQGEPGARSGGDTRLGVSDGFGE